MTSVITKHHKGVEQEHLRKMREDLVTHKLAISI
jgi:hypothetical protein